MVIQPYRDFSTTTRYQEELVEVCVRQALIDMNELETEPENLKVQEKPKAMIATAHFKKGALIMTPFTNSVAFAAEGSYMFKAFERDLVKVHLARSLVPGQECAFLRPCKLAFGPDSSKTVSFVVPFWVTHANSTTNKDSANMVAFSYKAKGGISVPCLKNSMPIDEGDTIVLYRSKKRAMDEVNTDAAAIESDEEPETKAGRSSEGKGACKKGRGRGAGKRA